MNASEEIVTDLYRKFTIEDFVDIPDDKFEETFYRMKSNLLEQRGWDHDLLTLLYKVKRRRHPHYFYGFVAEGISEFFNHCIEISKTIGLRRQIHFYYSPRSHGLGFDIKNVNSKLSIIAFDSVRMTMFLDTLKRIKLFLEEKSIQYVIYACQTRIQSDELNCQPYTYACLSQLAKTGEIHEQLINVSVIPQPQFYDSKTEKMCDYPEQVENIKWIDVKHLPEKILVMTQSYIIIARMFADRNNSISKNISEKFKKTIEPFLKFRQDNPSWTVEQCPKNNYITDRRQHIATFFSDRLCLSVVSYRQQFKCDYEKLIAILTKRSHLKMGKEIEQYLTTIKYPLKYKIELIEKIAHLIIFDTKLIYEQYFIKQNSTWCLEKIEDLFALRKIMLDLFKKQNDSKALNQKYILVDECISSLLDNRDENGINCFRHDLVDGTKSIDRNYDLLYKLIAVYGKELVCELSNKPYTGGFDGFIFYSQLIAKLDPVDLEEFFIIYPNATAIQNNWEDLRKFLGIKIYDDDAVTQCCDDNLPDLTDLNYFLENEPVLDTTLPFRCSSN